MSEPSVQTILLNMLADEDDAAYDNEVDAMVAPWEEYPHPLEG